jgi:hypothetical protein
MGVKTMRIPITVVCAILALSGCGGGDSGNSPQPFTTQIYSDSGYDGDIELTTSNFYAVTQGMSPTVQSVFAGIDPNSGSEYRSFLDFPLTGPDGVPGNASIQSAVLEIYIDDLQPRTGTLPIRIDLVAFQPPTLIASDFDTVSQPALASINAYPDFSSADIGVLTSIDVTPLMVQAQHLGLVDFQIRILEPLGPAIPVLLVIDDSTGANRTSVGPLLTVTYF